jgi:EAL and modified HD-GYP domain-containing signal transduction protein
MRSAVAGFFIGRQPIFTSRMKVFGYELQGQPAVSAEPNTPQEIGPQTNSMLQSFAEAGLDTLVSDGWAFIHFPRTYLIDDSSLHFSPARMIVEVCPDKPADEELEQALIEVEAAGYQVVVDKVTSFEAVQRLVRPGRIIKIDIEKMVRPEIAWLSTRFKNQEVRLIASGVKTMDEMEFCNRLGFNYFQGSFLYHPNPVSNGKIDSSRVTVLRALAVSADENSDFVQLERILSQDITITYKLLRLVNSVYYATADTVKSLQQAIGMVGRDQLRGWITLILMSTVDQKPTELTSTSVIRAKMCELLARSLGHKNVEEFFLMGLLSIVDALMDLPMEEVIAKLCLSKELVDGLLYREGQLGRVLNAVQLYEQGQWDKLSNSGINPQTICEAYINSIRWSGTIVNSVKG